MKTSDTTPAPGYGAQIPGNEPSTAPSRRRWVRGRRRRWAIVSLASFWLALLSLALPLTARADANTLAAYGATASGWAIQPFIVNDSFLNVPAADQSAPYVFVSMDNSPGARAKASYFFPGTAVNAVPNTQGIPVTVPTGVEARYPGSGSASSSVGLFNDGVVSQAAAGTQSAQASEGYALAQAAIASYQFAAILPLSPSAPPGVPPVPAPPTPPVPGAPTATAASSTPTASPSATQTPTPAASTTPCVLAPLCLRSGASGGTATRAGVAAPSAAPQVTLPDVVQQQLVAALKAAQLANPNLLALAGGRLAAPDATLPYLGADVSGQAVTRATDSGVGVRVTTRVQHAQLLQGLITFASVESDLQAVAPASSAHGSGTVNTTVTGAAIAGIPVTIGERGVTVIDQNASADQIQALSDQLNTALARAGIHLTLTRTTTKTDSGFWEGSGAGLEFTAEVNPAGSGLPSQASGIPATHVDVSIGKVSASIFATSGSAAGGVGTGSGDCFFCGGFGGLGIGGLGGGSAPNASAPPAGGGGIFSVASGLSGGQLLALVFIVQALATAAVAASAGYADAAAKVAMAPSEEETL